MQRPIRILVADHNRIFREGVCFLIELERGLELTAAVSSAEDAISRFMEQRPDLTLMDLDMSGYLGIDAICRIREIDPKARTIALITDECDLRAQAALSAGASLVLSKDSVCRALLPAIYSLSDRSICGTEAPDDAIVADS